MRCAIAYRSGQHHPQRLSTSDDDAGCRLPGCGRPAFKDEYGNVSQYCSQPHRRQAVIDGISEACLRCKIWPKNILNDKTSDFCSRACAMAAVDTGSTQHLSLVAVALIHF
ncbi:hypothetical protein PHLGIDRAFT_323119 [Phlebiopsis gigantea 11061_1 CR5-6]|uniref:Uncharacterized protein n=1 Tax=Phlebiopsis gigantea (strain 11061_1 CR5-6) TaxID=745531 RepID=A0A0C3NVM4_PHLG1|nr:hypothetical protein PHLGIDRAFT_323119 [Phlebiopsis gigantea 11061_1 CR5-6]